MSQSYCNSSFTLYYNIILIYHLQPLPSIFRGPTPTPGKDLEVPDEKESETASDEKSTKNFAALKTFMTPKGRKNSDSTDVTEAVYATRPIRKGGRRFSCMVSHRYKKMFLYHVNII